MSVRNLASPSSVGVGRAWLFYDGDCEFCTAIVRRLRRGLEARGYTITPLQDPIAQEVLRIPPDQLLAELRLVTSTGAQFGGADAVVFLAAQFWWLWALIVLSWIPGGRQLLRAAYRWIAARRRCTV